MFCDGLIGELIIVRDAREQVYVGFLVRYEDGKWTLLDVYHVSKKPEVLKEFIAGEKVVVEIMGAGLCGEADRIWLNEIPNRKGENWLAEWNRTGKRPRGIMDN